MDCYYCMRDRRLQGPLPDLNDAVPRPVKIHKAVTITEGRAICRNHFESLEAAKDTADGFH